MGRRAGIAAEPHLGVQPAEDLLSLAEVVGVEQNGGHRVAFESVQESTCDSLRLRRPRPTYDIHYTKFVLWVKFSFSVLFRWRDAGRVITLAQKALADIVDRMHSGWAWWIQRRIDEVVEYGSQT